VKVMVKSDLNPYPLPDRKHVVDAVIPTVIPTKGMSRLVLIFPAFPVCCYHCFT